MWKKILVRDTLERVVCIFLVSKFRIPKTLYLSDGEAENIQWYLKQLSYSDESNLIFLDVFAIKR